MRALADIGVGTSAAGFVVNIAAANELVQLLAGLVAIVSGIAAAVFYIDGWIKRRKK